MIGLFLKLSQFLPGKSRKRAEFLSLLLTVVAFVCAYTALYLVRLNAGIVSPSSHRHSTFHNFLDGCGLWNRARLSTTLKLVLPSGGFLKTRERPEQKQHRRKHHETGKNTKHENNVFSFHTVVTK